MDDTNHNLDELSRGESKDGLDKFASKDSAVCSFSRKSSSGVDSQPDYACQPIVWHYLTFNTDLPTPLFLLNASPDAALPSPPPCPDLKRFTSPFDWPESRKTYITVISCLSTAITAYASGSYSSGTDQMAREWGVSDTAVAAGITTFTCGFALGPMFFAPLSEINGRRPVFVATGVGYVLFQLTCALVPTYGGMLVARFLTGVTGSTFSTMVGGIIADIYHSKDRNTAMALFSGAALTATGLGPLISGYIAQNTTWRWIFYLQVIVSAILMLTIILFFRETRGSVIISRKAKALNTWYEQLEAAGFYGVHMSSASDEAKHPSAQRIRWKVRSDEERGSIVQMLQISLYRPFHMLFTEPVVFFFSLWAAFAWAVLYLTFGALPLIFETTYGFNLEQADSVFAATAIASILFTLIAIGQDHLARKHLPRRAALFNSPEGRLYFACAEAALLPIGCVWFAVTGAYPSIPWIVPTLGIGCATFGIFVVYLSVFNYIADSYHRYASSALAATSLCRNVVGGAFPLFVVPMFNKMTFQGAGAFLGGVSGALTLVPWVLLMYGPQIRAKSRLASEVMTE